MLRSYDISLFIRQYAINISQVDDNEPFSEYNGDKKNQGDYPLLAMMIFRHSLTSFVTKTTLPQTYYLYCYMYVNN